jgi:hypothetical protein
MSLAVGQATAGDGTPATASKATNVKSTVTITSGEGSKFAGKVTSSQKKCRAGRTVKLYYEAGSTSRGRDPLAGGDPLAGTTTTLANGEWVMNGAFFAAVYYAQVLAMVVHVNGATYHCGVDLSVRMHY